jgi:hypothetical protein
MQPQDVTVNGKKDNRVPASKEEQQKHSFGYFCPIGGNRELVDYISIFPLLSRLVQSDVIYSGFLKAKAFVLA